MVALAGRSSSLSSRESYHRLELSATLHATLENENASPNPRLVARNVDADVAMCADLTPSAAMPAARDDSDDLVATETIASATRSGRQG